MSYVVLTLVPRLTKRPRPGESLATGIREEGCKLCVILYDGKLDQCWRHKDEHILWAEKEEEAINEVVSESEAEAVVGVPNLGDTSRVEELVEVS
jgi:hypothetical protein